MIFAKFSDIFIDLSLRSSIRYLTNQKKEKKKKSRILIHPSPSSILSLFLHSLTHRELNSRKRSNLPLRFPDGEQTSALLFPLFFFPSRPSSSRNKPRGNRDRIGESAPSGGRRVNWVINMYQRVISPPSLILSYVF